MLCLCVRLLKSFSLWQVAAVTGPKACSAAWAQGARAWKCSGPEPQAAKSEQGEARGEQPTSAVAVPVARGDMAKPHVPGWGGAQQL